MSTHSDVAEFFGVGRDTVRKDWILKGMPGERGAYNLREIFEWWKNGRGSKSALASASGFESEIELLKRGREAEVRCKLAEAEKRELDNLVKRNQVLPRHEVMQLFSGLILAAKKVLLQLPDRLNPRFPRDLRNDLTSEVKNEVNKVLTEMADWKPDRSET